MAKKACLLKTSITLPEICLDRKTIGGNLLVQIVQAKKTLSVDIYEFASEVYIAVDRLGREFYIKLPGSRSKVEKKAYVLRAKGIEKIAELNSETFLGWDYNYRESAPIDPLEIAKSWKDQLSFIEEDTSIDRLGLRQPQIGALHAIASHWSVKKDPAVIVMPTGTGKTEVMLSTLILGSCKKVLILVPSNPLRDQIFGKITTLGCLVDIGVVPDTIMCQGKDRFKKKKRVSDKCVNYLPSP
jgi:primosomal protein N'